MDQGGLTAQGQVEAQDGRGAGAGRDLQQLLLGAQGTNLWMYLGKAR